MKLSGMLQPLTHPAPSFPQATPPPTDQRTMERERKEERAHIPSTPCLHSKQSKAAAISPTQTRTSTFAQHTRGEGEGKGEGECAGADSLSEGADSLSGGADSLSGRGCGQSLTGSHGGEGRV